MAQKGIYETHGKKLIAKYINAYSDVKFNISDEIVLVTPQTDLKSLPQKYPFLKTKKLVVKPDQLIGKRGKNNLILLDANYDECIKFINEKNSIVKIGKTTGKLDHFLIEPFVKHDKEYYVAIKTQRNNDVIYFSEKGGVDVEENWKHVSKIKVEIDKEVNKEKIKQVTKDDMITEFVFALYKLFVDFDFAYLEINPFTIVNNKIIPLDLVAKLDDTALFENKEKLSGIISPAAFGTSYTKEEAYIKELDEKTGSSLKLKILLFLMYLNKNTFV